jgi:Na+-transporting methylmalonyl-CoA/oxaloacetate decarboxylase gamma subunit
MIAFIMAGILYLGIVFVVAFLLSLVTIGVTAAVASFLKRFFNLSSYSPPSAKI